MEKMVLMGDWRLALIVINFFALSYGFDAKAFDDNVLFKFNWPGSSGADLLESRVKTELYTITSPNKEQYECTIPDFSSKEVVEKEEYTGKNPIECLSPLFEPAICSYRPESYWTYELCHGRYVIQYHEDRDGKKSQFQKYELGNFDPLMLKVLSAQYDEMAKNPNRKSEIPYKKIDGVNMPYVEIEMTDGTVCDINNKPRSIKIFYVCHQHDKQEIHSIKEVASCEYEAIVKTPLLCNHPDYRLQETEENDIICRPIGNAPRKPRALMAMEAERLKMRYQKISGQKPQKVFAIIHVDKVGQDGQPQLRTVEIHPIDTNGRHISFDNALSFVNQGNSLLKSNSIKKFLNGEYCLHGGSGWWKFELCYGRTITQYHVEADGTKTVIHLGKFDEEKHKEWIDINPDKKRSSKLVSHLYGDGDLCEEIKKPRQTEVKFKCVENSLVSPFSVSMYLEEHSTCEYELKVESLLFCNILKYADETYGIIYDVNAIEWDEVTSNLRVKDDDERTDKDEL